MMANSSRQNKAWDEFQAFEENPPSRWDEHDISNFRRIVKQLEEEFDVDLSHCQISDIRVRQRSFSGSSVSSSGTYLNHKQIEEKFCEPETGKRQIECVRLFFERRRKESIRNSGPKPPKGAAGY
jgi:hypothetical protein